MNEPMTREKLLGGPCNPIGTGPGGLCTSCGGTGTLPSLSATETVAWLGRLECRTCTGTGFGRVVGRDNDEIIVDNGCDPCSGTGRKYGALEGRCRCVTTEWRFVCPECQEWARHHDYSVGHAPDCTGSSCKGAGRVPLTFDDDRAYTGFLVAAARAAGFKVSLIGNLYMMEHRDTLIGADHADLWTAMGLAVLAEHEAQ